MAMTACNECRNEISTTAKACPKCGAIVPRAKIWPWLIVVPVVLVIAMTIYGASIPKYEIEAGKVREACEQIAAYDQKYICDAQYDEAIRKGEAESNN